MSLQAVDKQAIACDLKLLHYKISAINCLTSANVLSLFGLPTPAKHFGLLPNGVSAINEHDLRWTLEQP